MQRLLVVAVALVAAACGSGSTSLPQDHRAPATVEAHAPAMIKEKTTDRPLHYVFPVRGPGCSASPSSSHHDYPAADIFTQKGCRFNATVRGVVDEVSRRDRWDPNVDSGATRGGRSVSIVGDDGVRYYGSHLLRVAKGIKPGVRVHAGQLLGFVDNSGDARYTPTHVHYGISWPTRNGIWWVRRGEVWPQKYLAAWRKGEDLSPRREVRRTERRMGKVPKCQAEC